VVGSFTIYRPEVREFADKEVALLQNFAKQAVIAIENTRLLGELNERTDDLEEALKYQTATSDVLKMISGSAFDLQPVLDTVIDTAMRLCDADFAGITQRDGDVYRYIATSSSTSSEYDAVVRGHTFSPGRGSVIGRVALERKVAHIADITADPEYKFAPAADIAKVHTILGVPMFREGEVVGVIAFARAQVKPFTERQIELMRTFADQAVIAIENARLITENREALEQQTAIAQILQTINTSPGELQPVFDAILDKALTLCDAAFGGLIAYDGQFMEAKATRNLPPAFAEAWKGKIPLGDSAIAQPLREARTIHLDLAESDAFRRGVPLTVAGVEKGGMRTTLWVPLLSDKGPIGLIGIYRQVARPFSDKQIALLESFAAQAVIAMENARLLSELRESLERQTATAEVLQVINASPGNLTPVFEAMLDKALALCDGRNGLFWSFQGDQMRVEATRGHIATNGEYFAVGRTYPIGATNAQARLIRGERYVHILDVAGDYAYGAGDEIRRLTVEVFGVHTLLAVPLCKGGTCIGAFVIDRTEVKPFTDRQIALLESFAAQAVIAMENVRLFGELRQRTGDLEESLKYQTATSDVLKVISGSAFDLQPVLDTVVETAAHLCDADFAGITLRDGDVYRYVALTASTSPEYVAELRGRVFERGRGSVAGRVALEGKVVHVADITADPEYDYAGAVNIGKIRTLLGVPMFREGEVVGVIGLSRQCVQPFTERQIELVRTFADQAVIAIENARLLTETREALEQQTATTGVLQVINASPGNLTPVFEAMLDKALRLCDASFGTMQRNDNGHFHMLACRNVPAPFEEFLSRPMRALSGGSLDRLLHGEAFVQIVDVRERDQSTTGRRALVELAQARTVVWIPLRKDSTVLGTFVIYRTEVKPFSDKQIALLQNFAAQAVIAMDNARLLGELHQTLEYQTATSDVLKVISRSTFDLNPILDTLVETAVRLCHADLASINIRGADGFYRVVSSFDYSPELNAYARDFPMAAGRETVTGRVALEGQVVHILDVTTDTEYKAPGWVAYGNARTGLGVPLLRDGEPIGVIALFRRRVEKFTDRQIELVRTFADQAVVAMENARLLGELRDRQSELARSVEELTATSDVLKIISRSTVNLDTVLDTLVERVTRLCRADYALMFRRRDDHLFHLVASRGISPEATDFFLTHPIAPGRDTITGRTALERRAIHIPDVLQDAEYTCREQTFTHVRTSLGIPLLREAALVGIFVIARTHVEPYTTKEIELATTFADQAVIAIENARLFEELRESLEQQTATAEVLQVINASPGDLAPVFDAVLGKALELCDAAYGILWSYDGGKMHPAALRGVPPAYADFLIRQGAHPVGENNAHDRLLRGESVVHIADAAEDKAYLTGDALRRATVELGGSRTLLGVPLRKDDAFLGDFVIYRQEVKPFTDKQIALVQSFAAQAVIAMENARLLTETRESLEQQTATAEVLQVINSSPGDLVPVFDAILDKALRLSHSAFGIMRTYDGTRFHLAAQKDVPQAYLDFTAQRMATMGVNAIGPTMARVVTEKRVLQIVDTMQDQVYQRGEPVRRAVVDLAGARTILFVPLLDDDVVRGLFLVFRTEVKAYSDKEIALLQNFAAQAVIAMDNARLLGELRERQAELRVTFDNMGDGVALFDSTPRLVAWNRNFQQILDLPDALLEQHLTYPEYIRMLADRGEFGALENIDEELERRLVGIDRPALFARTRPDGKVIEARRNPVPGGGFVLIYSDITERKRAEAEISAARDAAEKALRELQTAQASLLHSQKMAALGQLTAGIAHEIKNPLNFVNNFADLSVELLDELKEAVDHSDEVDDTIGMLAGNLTKIAEHGRRADGIVKSMLAHSRGGSGDWQPTDLNALVEEALNLAYHGARAHDQSFNITMERDLDRNLAPIRVVPQDFMRVLLNLFGNGVYAAHKRSREAGNGFRPMLHVATADLGEHVEIRVRDNGTGIAPEHRERLFQPFFTTKPTGEGTGLGLSISYDIVTQQHGGTITCSSEVGTFTEFVIRLPRRKKS
jgi:GAF domain-containing protein